MPDAFLFDRTLLKTRLQRARTNWSAHDFLMRHMEALLADRLEDITRHFPQALLLGARDETQFLLHPQIGSVIDARILPGGDVVIDEEALPFADNSMDIILSLGHLHWINDLPGVLWQMQRILKPDGLLLAVFPGGESLQELRDAVLHGSLAAEDGAAPRLSPFMDIRDAGSLLQRARFALPVVDKETLILSYPDPLALMRELRGMGEANALAARPRLPLRRKTLTAIYNAYPHNAEGRIEATIELIALTGWKPHASQAKPAPRGSGNISLKDVLS